MRELAPAESIWPRVFTFTAGWAKSVFFAACAHVGDPAGGRPLAAPGKTRTAEARALLARTLGLAFRLAGRSGLKVADLAAGSLRRRWM